VLAICEEQLAEHGRMSGLRDISLVLSALRGHLVALACENRSMFRIDLPT
jgi:hypothetical protein